MLALDLLAFNAALAPAMEHAFGRTFICPVRAEASNLSRKCATVSDLIVTKHFRLILRDQFAAAVCRPAAWLGFRQKLRSTWCSAMPADIASLTSRAVHCSASWALLADQLLLHDMLTRSHTVALHGAAGPKHFQTLAGNKNIVVRLQLTDIAGPGVCRPAGAGDRVTVRAAGGRRLPPRRHADGRLPALQRWGFNVQGLNSQYFMERNDFEPRGTLAAGAPAVGFCSLDSRDCKPCNSVCTVLCGKTGEEPRRRSGPGATGTRDTVLEDELGILCSMQLGPTAGWPPGCLLALLHAGSRPGRCFSASTSD